MAAYPKTEGATFMATDSRDDSAIATIRNRIWFTAMAAIVAALALVPVLGTSLSFSFYLMLWITMATGLNIIAGFTGYMPLGYVAFYGIGAFATAILTKMFGVPVYFSILAGGVCGVLLSLLIAPTLKLKGIYFAIVSLGLAIICRLVIVNLPESWAGGSYGINLGLSISPVVTFYYMLAVMVAALLTITWLAQSRLGKALRAIRDDDQAAEVMGVNVVATRLKAWMLSALFGALAGGVEAWYTNIIDPESAFQFLVTAKTVIYAIAGGLGTVTGPVVGAIAMVWIDDLIWQRFPIFNLFLLGLAIILLILFLPRGIVGSLIQRKPSWRRYIL